MALSDMLPPLQNWPEMTSIPGIAYPEFLNASVELLDRNIEQGRGNRVAVRGSRETVTYAELKQRVERFTASLLKAGLCPGDRVLLRLINSPEFVVAWLSVLRAGAIVVATAPLLRSKELKEILQDSGAVLAICHDELLEELARVHPEFSHLRLVVAGSRMRQHASFEDWCGAAAIAPPFSTRADDIALLAYTSGSTGTPKGTIHFHRDILAIADTYARHTLCADENDVFGGHPTMAFTYALGELLIFPFRVGASTTCIDRFTPEVMLAAARDFGITILSCAPTSYKMMMRYAGREIISFLPRLRLCVSAGETLPAAVFNEWKARTGTTILDGIGSTEMLHIFVSNTPMDAQPACTGKPVPGYQVKVVNSGLRELPAGEQGLLAVKGPTGCRYWNRPDRQKEYVRGGWNLTGDLFMKDEQGYFHYGCRTDDMIVCGGLKIAGPEVENVLMQHPAVSEAAVVASADELKGFVPKAFIVLAGEHAAGEELERELKEFVKREIAPYKYPRKIEFVKELPRTTTGKLRRVDLRRKEQAVSKTYED